MLACAFSPGVRGRSDGIGSATMNGSRAPEVSRKGGNTMRSLGGCATCFRVGRLPGRTCKRKRSQIFEPTKQLIYKGVVLVSQDGVRMHRQLSDYQRARPWASDGTRNGRGQRVVANRANQSLDGEPQL